MQFVGVVTRLLVLRSRSLCTRTLDSEGALHTRCLVDANVWSHPHRPRDFRCHAHAFMNIISAVPFFTGDPIKIRRLDLLCTKKGVYFDSDVADYDGFLSMVSVVYGHSRTG